jgi:hypothetical protein
MFFIIKSLSSFCQDVGEVEFSVVTAKEWEIEAFLNTSGGGAGFQYGWTPNYYNKHFWEINFLYNKHPKAVRATSSLQGYSSSSYSFGKLYDLFFLRGGYGYQRILHHKPYWGGVEIRYTFSGGFSLGMGMPVYLRVVDDEKVIKVERYDPDVHTVYDIIGRAGFFKGFSKMAIRPGFYAKTGLRFDFSKKEFFMHVIEVGVTIDMIFPFIQQMAFIKAKPLYFSAYVAYHFGKKKTIIKID